MSYRRKGLSPEMRAILHMWNDFFTAGEYMAEVDPDAQVQLTPTFTAAKTAFKTLYYNTKPLLRKHREALDKKFPLHPNKINNAKQLTEYYEDWCDFIFDKGLLTLEQLQVGLEILKAFKEEEDKRAP